MLRPKLSGELIRKAFLPLDTQKENKKMIVTEKDIDNVLAHRPFNTSAPEWKTILPGDTRLVGVIVEALTVLRSIIKATPGPEKHMQTTNETLKAAAPDLLAALKDLMDLLHLGDWAEDHYPETRAARAAITKAEAREP